MTRDAKTKTGVSFCLFATLLTGCAGFSAITSIITTAIGGTFLVRSQTVERTFVAPASSCEATADPWWFLRASTLLDVRISTRRHRGPEMSN